MVSFPVAPKNTQNSAVNRKFWGVWLPVPTLIAIINSFFWIWLISRTAGLSERPKTDAQENAIIEQF